MVRLTDQKPTPPFQEKLVKNNQKRYKLGSFFEIVSGLLQRSVISDGEKYPVQSYRIDSQTDCETFLAQADPSSSHSAVKRVEFQVAALNQLAFDHVMFWLLDGNGMHYGCKDGPDGNTINSTKVNNAYSAYRELCRGSKQYTKVPMSTYQNYPRPMLNRLATHGDKDFCNRARVIWQRPKTIHLPYGSAMSGDNVYKMRLPMVETRFARVFPPLVENQTYGFIWIDLGAKPFKDIPDVLKAVYVKNCAMTLQKCIENHDASSDGCVGAALILSGRVPDSLLTWFHPDEKLAQQQSAPVPQVEIVYAVRISDKAKPFLFSMVASSRSHRLDLYNHIHHPSKHREMVATHHACRVDFSVERLLRKAEFLFVSGSYSEYVRCFWIAFSQACKPYDEPEKPNISKIKKRKYENLTAQDKQVFTERIEKNMSVRHPKGAITFPLYHTNVHRDMKKGANYGLSSLKYHHQISKKILDDCNKCRVLSLSSVSFRLGNNPLAFFPTDLSSCKLSSNASDDRQRYIVTSCQGDTALQQQVVVALMNITLFYSQLKEVSQQEMNDLQKRVRALCRQMPGLASIIRAFCGTLLSIRERSGPQQLPSKTSSADQKMSPVVNIEVFCRDVLKCDDLFDLGQQTHFDVSMLAKMIQLLQSCASDDGDTDSEFCSDEVVGAIFTDDTVLDALYEIPLIHDSSYCLRKHLRHVQPACATSTKASSELCSIHRRLRDCTNPLMLYHISLDQHDVAKFIYAQVDGVMRFAPEWMSDKKNRRINHAELSNGKHPTAAGELYFKKIAGQWSLYIINNKSGHYKPTPASVLVALDPVKDLLSRQQIDTSSVNVCNWLMQLAPVYVDSESVASCSQGDFREGRDAHRASAAPSR